jgi:integrase
MVGSPLPTSFNSGVPQHVVQKLLGHASPHMTAHYANPRELHQTGAFALVA